MAYLLGNELLPTMCGSLNVKQEKIFGRLLDILKIFITAGYQKKCKEFVEVLFVEFFQIKFNVGKRPILPSTLFTYKNKILALKFIKETVIITETNFLVELFLNYDCDSQMAPLTSVILAVPLVMLQHNWHSIDGPRAVQISEFDKQLKLQSSKVLLSIMDSIRDMYKRDIDQSTGMSLFLHANLYRSLNLSCCTAFAFDPQHGIELAKQKRVLTTDSPEEIARWLRYTRGMNKAKIGEYLGANTNQSVLHAFANTFNFHGLSFVSSLRLFLETFRLPGEAQIVARILEEFSRRLQSCNPSSYNDSDLVYQLAYSTLMLHTDFYSKKVKTKMTKEDFRTNTRRVITLEQLNDPVLDQIYDEITEKEIILQSDEVEHPLPLGSRGSTEWRMSNGAEICAAILSSVSVTWSLGIVEAINILSDWSSRSFAEQDILEYVEQLLAKLSDYVSITCELKLEKEQREFFSKILSTGMFSPKTISPWIKDFKNWLIDVCDDWGCKLGTSWYPILQCLAVLEDSVQHPSTSMDKVSSTPRQIDVSGLDGIGALAFMTALIDLTKEGSSLYAASYLKRIQQSEAPLIERMIRASYSEVGVSGNESFFILLADTAKIERCSMIAFRFVQSIAQDHMNLLQALPDNAMMDFVLSVDQFGVVADEDITIGSIEVFEKIIKLFYQQHRGKEHIKHEDFYPKWYYVLAGLSRIAIDQQSLELCGSAIFMLFRLIDEQGRIYHESSWTMIWRSMLLPLLEDMRTRDADTFVNVMKSSLGLLCKFVWIEDTFTIILRHLEDMCLDFSKICWLPEQGFHFLRIVILENHLKHFQRQHWRMIGEMLTRISSVLLEELPQSVEESESESPSLSIKSTNSQHLKIQKTDTFSSSTTVAFPKINADFPDSGIKRIAIRCAVQLYLLDLLKDFDSEFIDEEIYTIYGARSTIGSDDIFTICEILNKSFYFATSFNGDLKLRQTMCDANIAESFSRSVLSRQEVRSVRILVDLLYHLLRRCLLKVQPECLKSVDMAILVANKFYDAAFTAINKYLELRQPSSERSIGSDWNALIVAILQHWQAIYMIIDKIDPDSDFRKLVNVNERMIDSQMDTALKLLTATSPSSTVQKAVIEFIRSTHARLSQFYLREL